MWQRRRVTSFAWTRRAHDVPAVVRNLPALIGEILEDRTLLSGVTDSAEEAGSWAALLGSESSLSFVLPVESVSGLIAKEFSQELTPVVGEASQAGSVPASLHFQVDAQSNWREVMGSSVADNTAATDGPQVLVTVEMGTASPSEGTIRFVNISVEFVSDASFANGAAPSGESRFNLASDFDSGSPDGSLPSGRLLASATMPISMLSVVGVGSVITPTPGAIRAAAFEEEAEREPSSVISPLALEDQPAAGVEGTEFSDDLTTTSIGAISQPDAMFASSSESAGVPIAEVSADSAPVPFSPTVLFAVSSSSGSPAAYDMSAIVISPTDGLQAAAAPLMAVVETVLASLDMTASALLALLTGSGGGSSPFAPVVQPIVDSSQVVIDPKRPRWALHDEVIEELAMYSLVVAPDQHFELKDFGPAFRAADPVVRIEFDVPPQHGLVSATEIPGAFRYSADPGFSGVDAARFRVTRASGQTVAGSVTILVDGRGLPDRPPTPVRQVELPAEDQRLSESGASPWHSTPAAIDVSFGLLDGGMDLP